MASAHPIVGINDPLEGFIVAAREHEACDESLVWLGEQQALGATMRQMIARLVDEHREWAVWARTEMADSLSHAVRVAFSEVATRDDPRMAAHLDIYFATSRTEGDMLSERWNADDLPNIARQLDEGVIERRR